MNQFNTKITANYSTESKCNPITNVKELAKSVLGRALVIKVLSMQKGKKSYCLNQTIYSNARCEIFDSDYWQLSNAKY